MCWLRANLSTPSVGTLAGIKTWALGAEIGRQPIEFFDPSGPKTESEKVPYALSAGSGWIGPSERYSIGIKYKNEFEDADKVTLCKPPRIPQ